MSITIEKAKKILGKRAENLSNAEVQKMLESMYSLANLLLDKKLKAAPK